MKKIILFLPLIFLLPACNNHLNFDWVIQNYEPNPNSLTTTVNISTSIKVDDQNNTVNVGRFLNTLDFDPDQATVLNKTSNGNSDIYIQKLDASGSLLWVKTIGGSDNEEAKDVEIDGQGNIYVTGYYSGTVNFSASFSNPQNRTAVGRKELYLLKLDTNGNFIWVRTWPSNSSSSDLIGTGITLDDSGNIYLSGYYLSHAVFDNNFSPSIQFNIVSNKENLFIMKLNSNGYYQWVNYPTIPELNKALDIEYSGQGFIYSIGYYEDSSTKRDCFVQKINPNTNQVVWVKAFVGPGQDIATKLAVGNNDHVYVLGEYSNQCDFDPNAGTSIQSAGPLNKLFLNSLDAVGNFRWVQVFDGRMKETGGGIGIEDNNDEIYIAAVNNTGMFINVYNNLGQLQSNSPLNNDPVSAAGSIGLLSLDVIQCTAYISGGFNGSIDYDPSPQNTFIESAKSNVNMDVFVAKYSSQTAGSTTSDFHFETSTGDIVVNFCNSEDILLNGTASTNEDSYSIEIEQRPINTPNAAWQMMGCYGTTNCFTNGQVGILNLTTIFPSIQATYGFEYRVKLITRNLPCFSAIEKTKVFTICNT